MPSDSNIEFNHRTEKAVQDKYSAYDLSQDEKANIWKAVKERDEALQQNEQDFRDKYDDLLNREVDQIRENRTPNQQLNYNPPGVVNGLVQRQAEQQVWANKDQRNKQIHEQSEEKVRSILDNAQEDGRGPEQNPTRDFNRAHDNER